MDLKKFALIGYPLAHTLSPLIHNAVFKTHKIPAIYEAIEISPSEDLKKKVEGLKKNGYAGLNVTVPFKEKILNCGLDIVQNPSASKTTVETIGAANTLDLTGERIRAYNTDVSGFGLAAEDYFKEKTKIKNVLLLGAGGASRAIGFYLLSAPGFSFESFSVFDVDQPKAEKLILDLKKCGCSKDAIRALTKIEKKDTACLQLLVNATPLGLKKEDLLPFDEAFFHKDMIVFDAIYNPSKTAFLKAAEKKGALIHNGLSMLIGQALGAHEIWFSYAPEELRKIRSVMEEALGREGYKGF